MTFDVHKGPLVLHNEELNHRLGVIFNWTDDKNSNKQPRGDIV